MWWEPNLPRNSGPLPAILVGKLIMKRRIPILGGTRERGKKDTTAFPEIPAISGCLDMAIIARSKNVESFM